MSQLYSRSEFLSIKNYPLGTEGFSLSRTLSVSFTQVASLSNFHVILPGTRRHLHTVQVCTGRDFEHLLSTPTWLLIRQRCGLKSFLSAWKPCGLMS